MRLYALGKTRSRAMKTTLHRAEVHARNIRDLLVALALELAQLEYQLVMLRQLFHDLFDDLLQVSLPIQIVRSIPYVLELQRPVVRLPMRSQLLEKYQRAARTVAQLVLRQIRADRVDPGRKLFVLVEPVKVTGYPNERFLNQIFSPIPVPGLPCNELDQPVSITVVQLRECARVSRQMPRHQLAVAEVPKRAFARSVIPLFGSCCRHGLPFKKARELRLCRYAPVCPNDQNCPQFLAIFLPVQGLKSLVNISRCALNLKVAPPTVF